MSSSHRTKERESLSNCTIREVGINTETWKREAVPKPDTDSDKKTRGVALEEGTCIRIAPMESKCGGWAAEHFHERLKLPAGEEESYAMTFEGMGRECIAIALSPSPSFEMGNTYAIHIGGNGNLYTIIRRRVGDHDDAAVESCQMTGQVCTPDRYTAYWVIFHKGSIYVGMGDKPGEAESCIAYLDDSLQYALNQAKIRYVGMGNSTPAKQRRSGADYHVRIRQLSVFPYPSQLPLPDPLSIKDNPSLPEKELNTLLDRYRNDCDTAKKRAAKFGMEYKPLPPIQKYFASPHQKALLDRYLANPVPGFITGVDVFSKEEMEKREKRKKRFGVSEKEEETDVKENVLDASEAYDKHKYIHHARVDVEEDAQLQPNKIHLFAIDWSAFQQIRSDDVIAYFHPFGPSYIEWINEVSCNVLFEDEFSSRRALRSLSQPIPSPKTILFTCPIWISWVGAFVRALYSR